MYQFSSQINFGRFNCKALSISMSNDSRASWYGTRPYWLALDVKLIWFTSDQHSTGADIQKWFLRRFYGDVFQFIPEWRMIQNSTFNLSERGIQCAGHNRQHYRKQNSQWRNGHLWCPILCVGTGEERNDEDHCRCINAAEFLSGIWYCYQTHTKAAAYCNSFFASS